MVKFGFTEDVEYIYKKKQLPLSYEQAFSFEELYEEMIECKKGVGWKGSVLGFIQNAIPNISKMEKELSEGTYRFTKATVFEVWSPKKREIVACGFRDRIVQRSFCDNIVYPKMTKDLIYANVACQKGKGTDCGRKLLKKYMYRAYKQWGTDFYCLQLDIKGYYPHMRHEYINSLFKAKLTDKEYNLYLQIMDHYYPGEVGYNPGSQLVQIAGLCGLNELDHWIKENRHCKYYIRYMDDMIILHNDKKYLELMLEQIKKQLAMIGFSVNEKKTKIYKQSQNIEFLGFKWRITETGKILVRVKPESFKRAKKHWRNMEKSIENGKVPVTYKELATSIESYSNYISRANCNRAIQDMIVEKIERSWQLSGVPRKTLSKKNSLTNKNVKENK